MQRQIQKKTKKVPFGWGGFLIQAGTYLLIVILIAIGTVVGQIMGITNLVYYALVAVFAVVIGFAILWWISSLIDTIYIIQCPFCKKAVEYSQYWLRKLHLPHHTRFCQYCDARL